LLDVALAVWRRAVRRFSASKAGEMVKVFGPDRDHLHHRILDSGFNQRQAALILYGLAILLAIVGLMPVLGGSNWLAITAIALLVIGLTGLRYLAPIEFVESGHGLRILVRQSRSGRIISICYFLFDLVAFVAAGLLSWWLCSKAKISPLDFDLVFPSITVFAGCGSLAMAFAQANQRRWSRAGTHDFAETFVWLICGVTVSFTIHGWMNDDFTYGIAVGHLTAAFLSAGLVFLPRSITSFLQESVIDAMHRRKRLQSKAAIRTTLLYGAGDLGELFLSHVRISPPSDWEDDHFIGFIDDDKGLRNRRMRGFRILGQLKDLETLVRKHRINSVILTSSVLPEEQFKHLEKMAEKLEIELRVWKPNLKPQVQIDARTPATESPQRTSSPAGHSSRGSSELPDLTDSSPA
ncbi:MAG: hypothetical protein ACQKBU_03785, partial [Verrucomicrobiales bacterium]